jgi:hypothetical protein
MHDDDFTVAATVWMRILIGGRSMRCPSSVPDPDSTDDRFFFQQAAEFGHAACLLSGFNSVPMQHGNAGTVVSAIFEAMKSFQQQF